MSHNAGVWIDHKKAVIVIVSGETVNSHTLPSGLGPHTHYGGSQENGGEKKYEERRGHDLERYYDSVIEHLGHPGVALVFGPGEAKLELKTRLERSRQVPATIIELESADKLSDGQIVARVKDHFEIDK